MSDNKEQRSSGFLSREVVVSRGDQVYRFIVLLASGILIGITIGQYWLPVCR